MKLSAEEVRAEARFREGTARHRMTVLRDDGLYRHLRFRRPDRGVYWFDLITWPGCLTINGDCGTYVFARVEDMFRFFRGHPDQINPDYWGSKLLAIEQSCGRGSVKVFKTDRGRAAVANHIEDWPAEVRRKVFSELDEAWIEQDDEREFRDWVDQLEIEHEGQNYRLEDFWEYDLTEWHPWFLWNLHAIVWGIAQYDASKADVAVGVTS